MNEYLASLERDLALIEGGFKEEERRACRDYDSHDRESALEIAYCAYAPRFTRCECTRFSSSGISRRIRKYLLS